MYWKSVLSSFLGNEVEQNLASEFGCHNMGLVDLEDGMHSIIIFSIILAFSFFWVLFGYRFPRISFVSIVFTITSVMLVFILVKSTRLNNDINVAIGLGVSFFIALLCGFLKPLGHIMIGFYSGASVSLCLIYIIGMSVPEIEPYFFAIPVGVFALVGSVITPWKPLYFAIFGICNVAGLCILVSLDYFLSNNMLLSFTLYRLLNKTVEHYPCWKSWMYLLAWHAAILIGCFVQHLLTAKHTLDQISMSKADYLTKLAENYAYQSDKGLIENSAHV